MNKALPEFGASLQSQTTGREPGYYFALNELLIQCSAAAFHISEEISATYFTHSGETKQSMGT
jgi:hypothetical protein